MRSGRLDQTVVCPDQVVSLCGVSCKSMGLHSETSQTVQLDQQEISRPCVCGGFYTTDIRCQ